MYIQNQNLNCSCKHRSCTARLWTVFGSWLSHCIRISLRDLMQCIRSPPAPEAAFWGQLQWFLQNRDRRGDWELSCALEMQKWFWLYKATPRRNQDHFLHVLSAAKYCSSCKEGKVGCFFGFFFFPWENYFQGQKAFAYCLWGKEIQHLELGSFRPWRSLWNLSAWESLNLESNSGLRPSFIDISELFYGAVWNGEPPLTFLIIYECFKV